MESVSRLVISKKSDIAIGFADFRAWTADKACSQVETLMLKDRVVWPKLTAVHDISS
jgi:hypothetical protein